MIVKVYPIFPSYQTTKGHLDLQLRLQISLTIDWAFHPSSWLWDSCSPSSPYRRDAFAFTILQWQSNPELNFDCFPVLQPCKEPGNMLYSSAQNTDSHSSLGLFHIPLIYLVGFHYEMTQHFSSEPVFSCFLWSSSNNNIHFQKLLFPTTAHTSFPFSQNIL